MYAIRSYYAPILLLTRHPETARAIRGILSGWERSLELVGSCAEAGREILNRLPTLSDRSRVITSYSIHYTKLYDVRTSAVFNPSLAAPAISVSGRSPIIRHSPGAQPNRSSAISNSSGSGLPMTTRITSYNVCYTKLLR